MSACSDERKGNDLYTIWPPEIDVRPTGRALKSRESADSLNLRQRCAQVGWRMCGRAWRGPRGPRGGDHRGGSRFFGGCDSRT